MTLVSVKHKVLWKRRKKNRNWFWRLILICVTKHDLWWNVRHNIWDTWLPWQASQI